MVARRTVAPSVGQAIVQTAFPNKTKGNVGGVPTPPEVPEIGDEGVQTAAQTERQEVQRRRGRASTYLSGGSVSTAPVTSAMRFLGGAAS